MTKDTSKLTPRESVQSMYQAYDRTYEWGDWFYNEEDKTFYMVNFVKLTTVNI